MDQYINKDELINSINKLIEARKKKSNCSRTAAEQLNAFIYVLRIIEKMESVNIES